MGKIKRRKKYPTPTPTEAYAIGRKLLGLEEVKPKKRKIRRRKDAKKRRQ